MKLIIKNAKLIYPAIFEPSLYGRYATGFEYEGDKLMNNGYYPRKKDNLYGGNSKFRPQIHSMDGGSDYTSLLTAYNVANVRGIPLNLLFKDMTVDMELSLYNYDNVYGKGIGAGIETIWVDEAALLSHARSTITQTPEED